MREVLLDGRSAAVAELSSALAETLAGTGPVVVPLDAGAPNLAALRAAVAPEEPVEPEIAVIITTSGSTGEAKGVALSGTALLASAEATHERLGGPGHWLLATPAQYIGGVQVLVRSLFAGTRPGVVDLSVPFRSASFATAAEPVLDGGAGRRYTAMVPTQLRTLLAEGGPGLAALAAFDAVILGAAATSEELRAQANAAGVQVVAAYGMSETASGCVYDGIPLAGLRLRLADAEAGAGRIELSGPMLASGYRGQTELSRAAFGDGWFRTGDSGRLSTDGKLEVLGRTDDLINTGGVKVAPALVERALSGQDGVREVCVLGLPDEHWGQAVAAAIVPTDPHRPPAESDLREAVRAALGRAAVPKRFGFLAALPLRGPGKIDRAAVRDLLT
ncbi:MAG TPA: o-succinylbenzoate--CoA ligase [Pseudonocardiaceae bacterium]|jgi:O-succinylbenzoic acid--CoA ligase|nr:o-succinylbenzoate--CoA ligase [Pseudonocardiaceae bacterium]